MSMGEIIFPMTVREVWDSFFSDEPTYSFNDVVEEMGDRVDLTTPWEPSQAQTDFLGKPYVSSRMMKVQTKLPKNPF